MIFSIIRISINLIAILRYKYLQRFFIQRNIIFKDLIKLILDNNNINKLFLILKDDITHTYIGKYYIYIWFRFSVQNNYRKYIIIIDYNRVSVYKIRYYVIIIFHSYSYLLQWKINHTFLFISTTLFVWKKGI